MKKVMLFLMTIVLAFTVGSTTWAFSDSASHPQATKIKELQDMGVLSGERDGKFNPNGKLTYAAGVSMLKKGLDLSLARFLFIKAPVASDYFTNVPDDAWYSEAFVIAQVNGLELPKDVKPSDPMTREQFAHALFQAVEANSHHFYTLAYLQIQDEGDVAPDYMGAIQNLLSAKVIELNANQTFLPKTPITRGEAAGWLYNAIDFIKNAPDVTEYPEEPSVFTDMTLETKLIQPQINEVTVTAQAPHPGYGIRIASIIFIDKEAIIVTEPIQPDPDKMYPQVITEVKVTTYVDAKYTPVLETGTGVDTGAGTSSSTGMFTE